MDSGLWTNVSLTIWPLMVLLFVSLFYQGEDHYERLGLG